MYGQGKKVSELVAVLSCKRNVQTNIKFIVYCPCQTYNKTPHRSDSRRFHYVFISWSVEISSGHTATSTFALSDISGR